MDNFSHQSKQDYFDENILSGLYLANDDNAQSAYERWYNSAGHHKLVVGGLSGREAVAAYQYNEAIYWVYLYGN